MADPVKVHSALTTNGVKIDFLSGDQPVATIVHQIAVRDAPDSTSTAVHLHQNGPLTTQDAEHFGELVGSVAQHASFMQNAGMTMSDLADYPTYKDLGSLQDLEKNYVPDPDETPDN